MAPETIEWLLRVGGSLGFLCLILMFAVGALYRDNNKLRAELSDIQEKRVADTKESIRTLGESTKALQSLRELLQTFMDDLKRGRR